MTGVRRATLQAAIAAGVVTLGGATLWRRLRAASHAQGGEAKAPASDATESEKDAEIARLRLALSHEEEKHAAERRGRTKAERNLRQHQKQQVQEQQRQQRPPAPPSGGGGGGGATASGTAAAARAPESLLLTAIGVACTPFPKRCGTPRQGSVAPHARGVIELHSHVPREVRQINLAAVFPRVLR